MAELSWVVVNGVRHEIAGPHDRKLLFFIRDDLGLTGAKPGCGEGECGACSVLCDGEPIHSCMATVGDAAGRTLTTIEGLSGDDRLHPLQQAFVETGAMQCGYCTPGMIVTAAALLAKDPDPPEAEVRAALQGNICRCCTYPRILRAVRRAAELGRDTASQAGAVPPTQSPADLSPAGVPWDLNPVAQRGYFDVLPDGLVTVVPPPADDWAATGGAWVHVGADGATAFTGKVEVGQGTRTALSLLVAEELRLPLTAVRLVMGDTDLCPHDIGTFGSRGMPSAGPPLRAAAAGARVLLAGMAADRWGTGPEKLDSVDGKVLDPENGRSVTYAELVAGLQRVETVPGEGPLTPPPDWHTTGRPAVQTGSLDATTGAKVFPSDLRRPGMLDGAVLRPPAQGATLRSVDLSAARRIAGVTVVREGPFVAVVAPAFPLARRALAAVRAEWDRTPQPSEADLSGYLRSHPVAATGWQGGVDTETGDVEAALSSAPVRLDATYTTPFLAHVPMEMRSVIAEWTDGRLTIWAGTQVPFGDRGTVAAALGVPEGSVRVVVPDAGGGFGGKHVGGTAIEAARLARVAGSPVRLRWSREEEFTAGFLRPAAVVDVRSGALPGGRIAAWDFRNYNSGPSSLATPYEIPNRRLVFQPADSPLPQGPYRALAATANTFARESHMDELAHVLGLDPLEFRLDHLRDERLTTVLEAAAGAAGWSDRKRGDGRGTGIAAGVEKGGHVATCADVSVDPAGRLQVLRIVTAFECGAVVNPDNLANQIEGAAVMGLGAALFETVHFGNGRISNPSLSTYRVPRFPDVPQVEAIVVDRPDLPPSGGGETPIVAVAPALANAIFAACGIRLRSLPLAPDGVVVR